MAKYAFPAIFTREDDGKYSVLFPDIENCFTGGDNMAEAVEMAKDVLCLMLYNIENNGESVLIPSNCNSIAVKANENILLVQCDTDFYKLYFDFSYSGQRENVFA